MIDASQPQELQTAAGPSSPAVGAGKSRGLQAIAKLQAPSAADAEGGTRPSVGELLARPDVVEFVAHHANMLASPQAFEGEPLPEGLTPMSAFDLVEFVRRTGASMPVCGRRRSCGHEGSWYAMTPGFSARLAHLEYRTRAKGSLQQQFDTYRLAKGFYPPRLSELECALALDGASVPYESLRELCLGERQPAGAAERLAANVLQVLAELESAPGTQLDEGVLDGLFSRVDQGVGDLPWRPTVRPPTACHSICDRFSTGFIVSAFQEADPSDVAPVMLLLFCSEAMWKTPVFPRWNTVMEVVVRSLLFAHIGTPLLGFVPLALRFWRWQTGVEQGPPGSPRYGLIMAAAVGAAYMSARAEAPTSCLLDMDSVNYASFALPREGAICVGADGKRFMLESSELKRINTEMVIEQYVNTKELGSDFVAFICCDCDAIQTTIADGVTVFTDDTLEGLAEQMGVDPQGLAAEVAHYNEMVTTGKDEDFGKEEGFIALEEGPYFGCRIAPHLNQSCGGLLVDEDSRVLRYRLYEKGESPTEPIEGLYAGGELVPYSMHYGYALSHAMSQGRLAVKHALGK